MVVSDQKIREGFSARLERALLASAKVPDEKRRWRGWLAKRYGVSVESARKWLTGLALPELATVVAIALDLNETVEHLLTGRDGAAPATPALSDAESALVDGYRRAPALGQSILRTAAAAAAGSAHSPKARTLHVVAEHGAAYGPQAAAHELDQDLLALVLEQAERLTGTSAAQRAVIAAKVYQAVVGGERKPTAAHVLKLLRSA